MSIDFKACSKCAKTLPASEFNKNRKTPTGLHAYCRACQKIMKKKWSRVNYPKISKYQKNWRQNNPEKVAQYSKESIAANRTRREKNPEVKRRYKARYTVRNALRAGTLVKPTQCSVCGLATTPERLHGHHEDYDQPLLVVWMCRDCHVGHHLSSRV